MRLRAPLSAVVILSLLASSAVFAQTLRPSLSAAPLSAKEQVTVAVRGSAAFVSATATVRSRTTRFLAGRRADYEAIVAKLSKLHNVPEELIHRVIVRESKYQPNLIGRGGTLGMMQIKLATARGMGFTGTADDLMDAQTNLHWGVKYLAGAWRAAEGNYDLAVRKYAAGYYVSKRRRAEAR